MEEPGVHIIICGANALTARMAEEPDPSAGLVLAVADGTPRNPSPGGSAPV